MAEHYYEINNALLVIDSDLQDFLDDIHRRLQSVEQGNILCAPYGSAQRPKELNATLRDIKMDIGHIRHNH